MVLSTLSNRVGKSSIFVPSTEFITQTLVIFSRTQAGPQTILQGVYKGLPGFALLLSPFQKAFHQPKYTNIPFIFTKDHMLKDKINIPGLSWIEALDMNVDVPTDLLASIIQKLLTKTEGT